MPSYQLGLDLGGARDYAALAVVEHVYVPHPTERVTVQDEPDYSVTRPVLTDAYHVVHLQRWALGTPYHETVHATLALMDRPPLRDNSLLVYDKTGLGRPLAEVIDAEFQEGRAGPIRPAGITITGGLNSDGLNVPKAHLVSRVEILLQSGALRVAESLPTRELLETELRAFRAKTTDSGATRYEAGGAEHDDTVIALALALHRFYGRTYDVGEPRVAQARRGLR